MANETNGEVLEVEFESSPFYSNLDKEILSNITIFNKYAKHISEKNRRETWEEICVRNMNMHINKFPSLKSDIEKIYKEYIFTKKILPSMRTLQFAGKPIEINNTRLYNCSYMPIDDIRAFNEAIFLLLSGCGLGYSVQLHHIEKLPEIKVPNKNRKRKFLIGDSIEGWSDSVKVLIKSYFQGTSEIEFDFSDIREKGLPLLTSGGKAPGPQPLKECLIKIRGILDTKNTGEKLTSLECHDIICHIADAVLAGGIRRAACISLFSADDEDMLTCKFGNWWELNPQRARANNSAILLRHKLTENFFKSLWKKVELSGSGEPGIILSNDKEMGYNPCFRGKEKLLTVQGYKTFEELCDIGEIEIINKDNTISKSKVWNSGYKKTITFKNSIGEETTCTPDHVWMTSEKEEVQAKNLKNKRLMPFLEESEIHDKLYTKLGYIQGDASLTRLKSQLHKGFEIHIGKNDEDILKFFNYDKEKENQRTWYTTEFFNLCRELKFSDEDLPNRTLPKTFKDWTENQKLSFIKGIYSANGSIIKNHRISFKSTCKPLIQELQEFFKSINISTYYTTNKEKLQKFSNGEYLMKESYDLNISQYNGLLNFYNKIGFIHKYKMDNLKNLLLLKSPMIIKIEENDFEDVYDFTEPLTHWGVVNGYIAHNCVEASLKPFTFCNLNEINVSTIESQKDYEQRCKAVSFLGTLQASYTDFHYLRDIWKRNTEKDALLGISLTGTASRNLDNLDIQQGVKIIKEINEKVSKIIGINKAKRTTCIKPAGTSSIVLGTASGIHAYHENYYIRRIRLMSNDPLCKYLLNNHLEILEKDEMLKDTYILTIPQKSPENSIIRTNETTIEFLNRIKKYYKEWVLPGHRQGSNTHNISATVSIKDNEWKDVGNWIWENKEYYNGLSFLPYDGGTYIQPPFEKCSKETYEKLYTSLKNVDLTKVIENEDNTNLQGESACSGGACEII